MDNNEKPFSKVRKMIDTQNKFKRDVRPIIKLKSSLIQKVEEKPDANLQKFETKSEGNLQKLDANLQKVETNDTNRSYPCTYCGKCFTMMKNMYRHRKHRCPYRPNLQQIHEKAKIKLQVKQEKDNKDQLILDLIKDQKKLIENSEQTHKMLIQTIEDLKKHPQQINNNTNNYNLTFNMYFNDNDIDLYEIKKKLLGEQGAKNFLMGLVNCSTPNNKFQWFHDLQIFKCPEEIPIRVTDKKHNKMIIHNQKNSEIIDVGGVELNKICNRIVGKSYMKAVSTQVSPTLDQNESDRFAIWKEDSKTSRQTIRPEIEDRIESRFTDLYNDTMIESPTDKILKYEHPPTVKHLKDTIEFLCPTNQPL